MKLILPFLLVLCSCQMHTADMLCRHIVLAQYAACVEKYGKDNVEIWRMKLDKPVKIGKNTYRYHAQVRVVIDGKVNWAHNEPTTIFLYPSPQEGCEPYKRIK